MWASRQGAAVQREYGNRVPPGRMPAQELSSQRCSVRPQHPDLVLGPVRWQGCQMVMDFWQPWLPDGVETSDSHD